jgi:hypothetical protein
MSLKRSSRDIAISKSLPDSIEVNMVFDSSFILIGDLVK